MTLKSALYGTVFCVLTAGVSGGDGQTGQAQLSSEYVAHLTAAKNAARFDWTGVLARNCIAPAVGPVLGNDATDPGRDAYYAEPEQVFDNLYFLGTKFHTSWALTTSAGIILIDTLYNYATIPEIVDGLKAMHLNPADVKYVLITHGHSDHDEGARYFQETYGAHVMLGAGDWDQIANARRPMPGGTPTHDLVAEDGGKITLGDTTVGITLTPGHTPGAYGLIFQVKDRGRPVTVAYASGTAMLSRARLLPAVHRVTEEDGGGGRGGGRHRAAVESHRVRRRLDEGAAGGLAAGRATESVRRRHQGVANYFTVMTECALAAQSVLPK